MKDQHILEIPVSNFEKIENDPSGQESALTYMRRKHSDACFTDESGKVTGIILHEKNGLGELLIDAKQYGDLQYLNLAANKSLTKITFQGEFPQLKHIDLSKCGLSGIILPQKGFPVLEQLYLGGNALSVVDFRGDYGVLELLDMGENAFLEKAILKGNFAKLQYLSFYKKEKDDDKKSQNIALKSFGFDSIPNLKVLDLENCKLKQLPENFLDLKGLEILYLNGNEIEDIPQSVIGSGKRHNAATDLFSYLSSISEAKVKAVETGESVTEVLQYLHQSKLFLIGNGEVGKTSIRRKLKDKNAPLVHKDDRTEIIETESYFIKNISKEVTGLDKPIDYRFDIWDFGGQDKYREIQQLFCSPKSLYVYVTSPDDKPGKEDYVGYEYWLSMVKAYAYDTEEGKDSPVIFVVNKIDKDDLPIGEVDIVNCFPNAKKFHKISADTLKGFQSFENEIKDIIPEISKDVFSDKYAKPWMEVKEKLETLSKTVQHIYLQEYLEEVCKGTLNEKEAKSWLRILDRIGTVIYFGEHEGLKDWIILNPEWVKNALSKVIEKALSNYGIVREVELTEIWKAYNVEEHEKFKVLLLKYKLAYLQKNLYSDTIYIIPSALPVRQPIFPEILKEEPTFQLKFVFDPFIPAGTVSKLTVGLFEKVFEKLYWRKNVVLHENHKAYVHVKEDWEGSAVFADFYGEDPVGLFHLVLIELQKNIRDLKDAKQFAKLGLTIEGFDEGAWGSAETLKRYKVGRYSFLWEDRRGVGLEMPFEPKKENVESDLWTGETDMNILFLASNPGRMTKLDLEKEHSKIHQVVQGNNKIKVFSKFATSIEEMNDGISDHKPVIVHFAGHGTEGYKKEGNLVAAGLVFHDGDKRKHEILSADEAALIFETIKELNIAPVGLVVLNNCYSEPQAVAISQSEIFVIGINSSIGDEAAIKFSRGFYRTIAKSPKLDKKYLIEATKNGLLQARREDRDFIKKVSLFYNGNEIKLTK